MGQFFKNTNLHVNTINCLSSTITIVYHRYTNLLAVFFHKWKSSEKIGKQINSFICIMYMTKYTNIRLSLAFSLLLIYLGIYLLMSCLMKCKQ